MQIISIVLTIIVIIGVYIAFKAMDSKIETTWIDDYNKFKKKRGAK